MRSRAVVFPKANRQLIVGLSETPDYRPLPGADNEIRYLINIFPEATVPKNKQATRMRVRQEVGGCSLLHLICHAFQIQRDPAPSFLALWDAHWTVAQIAAHELRELKLAFLSVM